MMTRAGKLHLDSHCSILDCRSQVLDRHCWERRPVTQTLEFPSWSCTESDLEQRQRWDAHEPSVQPGSPFSRLETVCETHEGWLVYQPGRQRHAL